MRDVTIGYSGVAGRLVRRALAWTTSVLWVGFAFAQPAQPISLHELVDQLASHPEARLETMEHDLAATLGEPDIPYRTQRGLGEWSVTHANVAVQAGGSTIDSITIRSMDDKVQFVTVDLAQSSCLSTANAQRILGPFSPAGAMNDVATVQLLHQRRRRSTVILYAEYHHGQPWLPSCVAALMVTYEPQVDRRPGLSQLGLPHH